MESNESSKRPKKIARTDDQSIVEAATISAAPTARQLDPIERQRRMITYKNFLNRGGPEALGTKDIPQGAQGCLKSLTFVITGVLPSLERDECKKIIESYGGRVTTAVSGKTDYLLAGRDVGKTKTDKAEKLRVKIITEDDLLEMIRTRSGTKEDSQAKSPVKKSPKPTALKPRDTNTFVSISSPKLQVYKQDDGILCKYRKENDVSRIKGFRKGWRNINRNH